MTSSQKTKVSKVLFLLIIIIISLNYTICNQVVEPKTKPKTKKQDTIAKKRHHDRFGSNNDSTNEKIKRTF